MLDREDVRFSIWGMARDERYAANFVRLAESDHRVDVEVGFIDTTPSPRCYHVGHCRHDADPCLDLGEHDPGDDVWETGGWRHAPRMPSTFSTMAKVVFATSQETMRIFPRHWSALPDELWGMCSTKQPPVLCTPGAKMAVGERLSSPN